MSRKRAEGAEIDTRKANNQRLDAGSLSLNSFLILFYFDEYLTIWRTSCLCSPVPGLKISKNESEVRDT